MHSVNGVIDFDALVEELKRDPLFMMAAILAPHRQFTSDFLLDLDRKAALAPREEQSEIIDRILERYAGDLPDEGSSTKGRPQDLEI